MQKNIFFICVILALSIAVSVLFISSSLASPYVTQDNQQDSQEQEKDIEYNESQISDTANEMIIQEESGNQEDSFSDTQDQPLDQLSDQPSMEDMEEKNWENQDGVENNPLESLDNLEEEPLERIEGMEEEPPEKNSEENPEAPPLPAD